MAIVKIQIDDGILAEAKKVLHSLGMDVEMAVNIYLRRIVLEKGLPMNMKGADANKAEQVLTKDLDEPFDDAGFSTRTNNRITPAMVDEVWQAFLRYVRGSGEISSLSKEVSVKTGMNQGSAFIYLMVLANLVKGEPNTRVLKYRDLEYLMGKILAELGENEYQKALQSLRESIPYWREKISSVFADKVEAYCKKDS